MAEWANGIWLSYWTLIRQLTSRSCSWTTVNFKRALKFDWLNQSSLHNWSWVICQSTTPMTLSVRQRNVFASDLASRTMPAEPQKPSLYERLGGIYSISCVVDDLIDRVMTDARLNANPAVNEAHHKVPPPGFKYLVTEMVGWASGGPQVYTGRPMRESHEHLKITPKEWEAFMDDLQQSLDRFNVPSAEQTELKAIVQSTYGDIVIGKDEAA